MEFSGISEPGNRSSNYSVTRISIANKIKLIEEVRDILHFLIFSDPMYSFAAGSLNILGKTNHEVKLP